MKTECVRRSGASILYACVGGRWALEMVISPLCRLSPADAQWSVMTEVPGHDAGTLILSLPTHMNIVLV